MDHPPPIRRRSPLWVRELTSSQLHAIALRVRMDQENMDLTPGQEWLWRALVSELEYRRRTALRDLPFLACSCELCMPPFPYGEQQEFPF